MNSDNAPKMDVDNDITKTSQFQSTPVKAIEPDILETAVQELRAGQAVAFPTETVYGLGVDARNAQAIAHLYELKGRPTTRPLTVHLSDTDEIEQWVSAIPALAKPLIERFCPGPLTLVMPRATHVLDAVTAGQPTVGIRIPSHPFSRQLIRAFGNGLVAPSANRSGNISPTTAHHVRQEFGEDLKVIIDGGPCALGLESTILDVSCRPPRILRLGLLSRQLLAETIGMEPIADPSLLKKPLERHYHPRTPTEVIAKEQLADFLHHYLSDHSDVALLYRGENNLVSNLPQITAIALPETPEEYASHLYSYLRYLDARHLQAIIIEDVPHTDAWEAVHQRLAGITAK